MAAKEKYIKLAKDLGMVGAKMISPGDLCFDVRAILKCRWGCDDFFRMTIKCSTRGTSLQERIEIIRAYKKILLVHSHDAHELSKAVLEIERAAFLEGHYFASALKYCKLCKNCAVDRGKPCPTPEKVRPCEQTFGIDMYKTVRNQGLPCDVLHNKTDVQNRYGFVLIK